MLWLGDKIDVRRKEGRRKGRNEYRLLRLDRISKLREQEARVFWAVGAA